MTRVDFTPDEQFLTLLEKARADLDALKNGQFSGSDSNRVYYLLTSNDWDYFTDVAAGADGSIFVNFNCTHQDYGYGVVAAEIWKDVVDAAHKLKVGDVGLRDMYSSTFPPTSTVKKTIGWQVGVHNDDSVLHRYYFKLHYLMTDTLS